MTSPPGAILRDRSGAYSFADGNAELGDGVEVVGHVAEIIAGIKTVPGMRHSVVYQRYARAWGENPRFSWEPNEGACHGR